MTSTQEESGRAKEGGSYHRQVTDFSLPSLFPFHHEPSLPLQSMSELIIAQGGGEYPISGVTCIGETSSAPKDKAFLS